VTVNEWATAAHAEDYLVRGASYPPHRDEGEAVLLAELPAGYRRVLDLGCGDGRLLSLVLGMRPDATGVALDMSPPMLAAARARFAGDSRVEVVEHDLDQPLPDLGRFDVVVSAFAIHHVEHERKRALYGEVLVLLEPGGLFANLEHVASPTERLTTRFLDAVGARPGSRGDPSNRLLDVETQLLWLRELGFDDVDCHWKWRELALLAGVRRSR
jgi:tRNA (cmo5U34)-methyltransferase